MDDRAAADPGGGPAPTATQALESPTVPGDGGGRPAAAEADDADQVAVAVVADDDVAVQVAVQYADAAGAERGAPMACRRSAYWSLQKVGSGANGAPSSGVPDRPATSVRAARLAVSPGMLQCSTRRGTPS
ncbi:hypothetical protein [Phytohabitans rumicis]|uniref:Uncharacterized protein n=1 Tax=Phytohabitans rumicis TaxID=1076125 RepID=A0A6V8LG41_9ACTN|nr:hypothetical protein [Phytohabitans rumicis]GFJ96213.1 hypothetical protein Prum_098550 [Phytohabitans rumicis]